MVDGVKLDIRQLPAARVLGIALSPEKQDQQNVAKLKGLGSDKRRDLVDLVKNTRLGDLYADSSRFREIVSLPNNDAEVNAAISNMSHVVRELHDPSSQLLRALKRALSEGKLCVVDISQMRGPQGLQLAGIILSDIFQHNQEQFTEANPQTIPTIAVIEEAQSVLGASSQRDDGPFVSWVKEGRNAPSRDVVGDPFEWARLVVKDALNELLGPEGQGWSSYTDSAGKAWARGKLSPAKPAKPDLFASSPPDDEPPF